VKIALKHYFPSGLLPVYFATLLQNKPAGCIIVPEILYLMTSSKPTVKAKPVTIITGFLGAGKTSFLNEYIAFQKDWRPVIIENEFGEQGIDAGLILSSGTDIFELNSGCICCSLNDDFYDLLNLLERKRDEFDELVIETTGIADPATVAQPLLVSPRIERSYRLERVICIVDARMIEFELKDTEEARRQIAFSDILLISKCDAVRPGYVDELKILLQNINPFAAIFSGDSASGYPLDEISALTRADFNNRPPAKPGFSLSLGGSSKKTRRLLTGNHEHRHHDITSLSFVFDRPFDLLLFERKLFVFLNFQAKDIYRVKGILWVTDADYKVIIQSVVNLMGVSAGKDWGPDERKESRIVIIGKNLKAEGFEKMLKECLDSSFQQSGISHQPADS